MSGWLQRLVVTVDMTDNSAETLKYAAFLADTYDAALDVMSVTHCPKQPETADQPVCPHATLTCAHCAVRDSSPSPAERRRRIAAMLAALPSKAARGAETHIGAPTAIAEALRHRRYDLAILDEACGRRCPACRSCPVFEALKGCPSCGMMRVQGPVKLPAEKRPRS